MEPENKQAELKVSEGQEDLLNKKVGDLEMEKLKAAEITIEEVSIKDQTKKDSDKVIGKIVHLMCKHPDKEELIPITKVFYRKDEKESVKEAGLWYNVDKVGDIQKGSALASLMSHKGVLTVRELAKQKVGAEPNEAGYLCIKAY